MKITKEVIQQRLVDIEEKFDVRVLFALESGSRMWGFASENSDFDIRFVYIKRSYREHLTVFPVREVIENCNIDSDLKAGDCDFSGWDLRKFLTLVFKSNPTAFEWLASPIVYAEVWPYWHTVRAEVAKFFSPLASREHYVSMAKHNYREHLRDGAAARVRLKKYLYIARPLLCHLWVETLRTVPTMDFITLLDCIRDFGLVSGAVKQELIQLAQRKREGDELDEGPANPVLNAWFDAELARMEVATKAAKNDVLPEDALKGVERLYFDACLQNTSF